jgi:hypothetical protein
MIIFKNLKVEEEFSRIMEFHIMFGNLGRPYFPGGVAIFFFSL